tara:strand:- start:178 stop:375 length:198 start_codon:yes stop_codon:yes gene_type:complete
MASRRVENPEDVVSTGEIVFVKVIQIEGSRIKMSMKRVDQASGEDIGVLRIFPLLLSIFPSKFNF